MRVADLNEYHPYAACLMFKACHDREVVRHNLDGALTVLSEFEHAQWKESQK